MISIYDDNYKPQFSGHETFPIRYGWLEKAFFAVDEEGFKNQKIFSDESAIAHFGVGKNMVSAIRFWAQVSGIMATEGKEAVSTLLGELLLRKDGLDPYLENPTSLWRLHWEIASNPKHTSVYWLFNIFNEPTFDRDYFFRELMSFVGRQNWKNPTPKTVVTDVSVLLANYTSGIQKKGRNEESLASPFTELGLIKMGANGQYKLNWGQKPSLTNGVFAFAVCDFWEKATSSNTISFQSLLLDPGSPGRVFFLEEAELAFRLMDIDQKTDGAVVWSETAGLKQLIRKKKFSPNGLNKMWQRDYITEGCNA